MILEAVPALPDKRRNAHQVIKRASRHYAEALQLYQADRLRRDAREGAAAGQNISALAIASR